MLKNIPTNFPLPAVLAAFSIGLTGCNPASQTGTLPSPEATTLSNNRPQVVATTSVLCDLTKQVAGNTIDLTCLIDAGFDPHLYQPKPDDRKAIEQANLILYSGYDFEPSLIKLIDASKNQAPKIAVGEQAVPQPQQFEEDGKKVTDPHLWHNVQNSINMVGVISNKLGQVSPNNAALYSSNAGKIKTELTQLDSWIKSQVATIPPNQRKLVTTHDALGYYVKAYGLEFEGALSGISTEEKPTAARVKELVTDIKQAKVPTIFAETTINSRLIETVAREAQVKVADSELFADNLGEPGSEGDTYQKMMVANTRTIVAGLGGKYTPFSEKPPGG
jgi:manganese/iron transport system substrate-binding protein